MKVEGDVITLACFSLRKQRQEGRPENFDGGEGIQITTWKAFQVRSLCVGTRTVQDLPVSVMDCTDISEYAETKIDGYLGYNFLKGTAVTINVLDLLMVIHD